MESSKIEKIHFFKIQGRILLLVKTCIKILKILFFVTRIENLSFEKNPFENLHGKFKNRKNLLFYDAR
jgi:hypothetical protein